MSRSTCAIRRPAFTLVELLVVIGIIAIIGSLLVPALARARVASRDAQCLSNLHQLGAAFAIYRADYDVFPCPAQTAKPKWWSQDWIYPVVYGSLPDKQSRATYAWLPGTIFECPAAAALNLPQGEVNLWRSYGMSARLNDRYDDTGDYRGDFKHPNEVLTPGQTSLLIDCTQQWSGTITTPTPAPQNSQLQHVLDAAPRHHMSLNVLYVDLHAAPRTLNSIPQDLISGNGKRSDAWQTFWAGI